MFFFYCLCLLLLSCIFFHSICLVLSKICIFSNICHFDECVKIKRINWIWFPLYTCFVAGILFLSSLFFVIVLVFALVDICFMMFVYEHITSENNFKCDNIGKERKNEKKKMMSILTFYWIAHICVCICLKCAQLGFFTHWIVVAMNYYYNYSLWSRTRKNQIHTNYSNKNVIGLQSVIRICVWLCYVV